MPQMLETTWKTILMFIAGLATLAQGFHLISRFFSPVKILKERVDKHDVLLDNDNRRFMRQDESITVLVTGMLALLDHAVSDSGAKQSVEAAKSDLQKHLAKCR